MGNPKSSELQKWNIEVILHSVEFLIIRELSFRGGRGIGIVIFAFR